MCSACRPHDLLKFINQFVGENNWTRKRWNSTFQRPFNVAVRLGFVAKNPFKGLTFPDGEDGRDWTHDEYLALLKHAKLHVRRFIVMIRIFGLRPGEVRNLEGGVNVRIRIHCLGHRGAQDGVENQIAADVCRSTTCL